jgi:hypothetical protein
MYGDTTKAMAHNDLTRDSLNAIDAVAEYIAAVEDWQAGRSGATADYGSRASNRYEEACDRLDAAHARMKGVAK